MKVLVINGSPNKDGCTKRGLDEVMNTLHEEGIETEYIQIGDKEIRGCMACNYCREHHKCAYDDIVNESAKIFEECDGILVGSPVYYSNSNGTVINFLERLFHSSYIKKSMKVGAAIASSRRAGSTSVLDEIYKFYTLSNMPVVASSYWAEIHGYTKEDVEKDKEGLQTMRNLGKNMAFMIKSIHLGKEKYGLPEYDKGEWTNFI